MRRRTRPVVALLLAALVAGCTGGDDRNAEPSPSPEALRPLDVTEIRVPDLSVPHYDTTGTYPHVAAPGLDLRVVNRALRLTVFEDEAGYRANATRQLREVPTNGYTGTYDVDFDRTLLVANSALVSTMYPVLQLYPGGNDGSGWLGTTVLVPSGAPVGLDDLVAGDWLATVARLTRAEVEDRGYCPPDPEGVSTSAYRSGLAPRPTNYRHFALTPDGLDIGLVQGQIGAEACGSARITLPWATLRPFLSDEGERLADAAGQALTTAPCSLTRLNQAFEDRPVLLQDVRLDETGMAVVHADCVPGWAHAFAAPPGILEHGRYEDLLFKADGRGWTEVAVLPTGSDDEIGLCDLTGAGVPTADARRLLPFAEDRPCRQMAPSRT